MTDRFDRPIHTRTHTHDSALSFIYMMNLRYNNYRITTWCNCKSEFELCWRWPFNPEFSCSPFLRFIVTESAIFHDQLIRTLHDLNWIKIHNVNKVLKNTLITFILYLYCIRNYCKLLTDKKKKQKNKNLMMCENTLLGAHLWTLKG